MKQHNSGMFSLYRTTLPTLRGLVAAAFFVASVGSAQITEIIDGGGDNTGNLLLMPAAIAVDGAGNVYLTGQDSNNAFKITDPGLPTQSIFEIIDSTGAGPGKELISTSGLAVDGSGSVFVGGFYSSNAFKITDPGLPTQSIFEIIKSGNGVVYAKYVAVDTARNVYVADHGGHQVFKITPAGDITTIIDSTGDNNGNLLLNPMGLAVDGLDNVYVAGVGTANVFKIAPDGEVTEILSTVGFCDPNQLAVDGAENVYVTCHLSSTLLQIKPDGTVTEIINSEGDGLHALTKTAGVAVDGAGNVYVAGQDSDNAFKITDPALPTQRIRQIIDSTGTGQPGEELDGGGVVAVDGEGNVYVSGAYSDNVFMIAPLPDATCTWYCGTGVNAATDGYVVTGPAVLGGTFGASVTGCAVGNGGALLAAYSTPLSFLTVNGEILVNVADPNGELFGMPMASGNPAAFSLPVPNDPALSGFVFYTQAASFFPLCLHCAHECTVAY